MYIAKETRYDNMKYNYCGASGLKLPAVSLGLWHNFGSNGNFDTMMDMCETAFDHLYEGRIYDVAGPLRRLGQQEISGGKSRSESEADGT